MHSRQLKHDSSLKPTHGISDKVVQNCRYRKPTVTKNTTSLILQSYLHIRNNYDILICTIIWQHNDDHFNVLRLKQPFCFFTNNFCNRITKTSTIHIFNLRLLFITSKSLMCKWSMFEMMKKKPLDFHLSYPGTDQWHRYITLNALAISGRQNEKYKYLVSCFKLRNIFQTGNSLFKTAKLSMFN